MWWETNPERWAWEAEQMREWYPGWRSFDRPPGFPLVRGGVLERIWAWRVNRSSNGYLGQRLYECASSLVPVAGLRELFPRLWSDCVYFRLTKAWAGTLSPLACSADPSGVLAALSEDRHVLIHRSGKLDVDPDDYPEHRSSFVSAAECLRTSTFSLIAVYREPPQHPAVVLLHPEPSWEALQAPDTHFWSDGSICPLFPPDGTWSWERPNSMADYLNWVAMWLVKYAYWELTRGRGARGVWLGTSVAHDDVVLLRQTPHDSQCWCGSGREFADCHGNVQLYRSPMRQSKPRCRLWPL